MFFPNAWSFLLMHIFYFDLLLLSFWIKEGLMYPPVSIFLSLIEILFIFLNFIYALYSWTYFSYFYSTSWNILAIALSFNYYALSYFLRSAMSCLYLFYISVYLLWFDFWSCGGRSCSECENQYRTSRWTVVTIKSPRQSTPSISP